MAEGAYYRIEQGTSLRAEPSTAAESRQAFSASIGSPGSPAGFSGAATTAPVGGYANLGSASNRFAGSMLRNDTGRAFSQGAEPSSAVIPTRLTLSDLPRHTSVDLNFLFAAIDSWDGNRETDVEGPADVFGVASDGRLIFAETFENTDAADGRVDLTDFAVLKQNFGWPGDRSRGDLNADRFVNLNDFAILKANFGRVAENPVD